MDELPPGYVSLALLKERWLQKQKEKKQREESRNDDGGLKSEKIEDDGPLVGAIERETRKENAMERIGGYGNGERKKKRYRKKKHPKTKQPLVDEENENPRVGVGGEMERSNGYKKASEIIRGNKLKMGTLHDGCSGGGRIFGKFMEDVSPRDGVREEVSKVKSVGVRGGFRRNATDRGAGFRSKEYRVKLDEFNSNEVDVSLEKKVVDGKGDGNGLVNRRRNRSNWGRVHKNKEDRVKLDNLKVNEAGMSSGKKVVDEKEKVMNRTGKRRNGNNRKIEYSLKGSGTAMRGFKGNEVEPKLERIAEDQVFEGGSKIDGFDGIDRNGLVRQDHRVERESLNDTTTSIAPENKAWGGVSAVDRAINGKNGEAGNGFRSDGSRRGNVGRKLGRLAFNDLSAGNAISSMELNVGKNKRYGSSGRSEVWKTKQNNGGMVWVKKEEKSSANAAEAES